ncbi:MAG: PEPxxWA-CTERM sorting domain-containing protein [Gammaproteobacteria bacterium]
MFKRILGSAILAMSCAAAQAVDVPATQPASQWNFSFTGFEDVGYSAFDPTLAVSGSFSGTDSNGDGAITLPELTSLRFEGQNLLQCSASFCDVGGFSFTPGQPVQLNVYWVLDDWCCNHIRTFQTGDQLFYNNYYESTDHYRIWRFTPDTQYLIAAVPEPDTWAMTVLGLALVGALARRRRQG